MIWWKRKRRSRCTILSVICTLSALAFLSGNMIILLNFRNKQDISEEYSAQNTFWQAELFRGIDTSKLFHMPDVTKAELHLRKLLVENPENLFIVKQTLNIVNGKGRPFVNPFEGDPLLDCDGIKNMTDVSYIASGWTKAVYKAKYKGRDVAVKVVDTKGWDYTSCIENGRDPQTCHLNGAKKLVKELLILRALNHSNIAKVIAYCVPSKPYDETDDSAVTLVTELGTPLDLIRLLQMSWEDRLRVVFEVTNLLHFLANTPYGSLALLDLKRQQFVLVNGTLKLSDVDDIGLEEQTCKTETDSCSYKRQASQNMLNLQVMFQTECVNNYCVNYNEKVNAFKTGQHFTLALLPHGAPKKFQPNIQEILQEYTSVNLSSGTLVKKVSNLVDMFKSGYHLDRQTEGDYKTEYTCLPDQDLPGLHDYRCRYSIGFGCYISVYDQKEAEVLCNNDRQCKGFVISPHRTWSGNMVVHLKNGTFPATQKNGTSLCFKPSG